MFTIVATAKSPSLQVRGSCAVGHVTEVTADKGRTTWQGPCAHDGCDLPVKARRIPRDRVPAAPPPAAAGDGSTRVVRIADYADTTSGAQDDPGGLHVAEPTPAPVVDPDAGGGDGAAADGPPADPLDEHGERGGLAHRFRHRRRTVVSGPVREQWTHPLGI